MNKIFCPNCEEKTECEYRAELYACNECGEDFADFERPRQEELVRRNDELQKRLHGESIIRRDLEIALQLILDSVDYTAGSCGLTEMVGAVLPFAILGRAKNVLNLSKARGTNNE